MFDWLRLPVLAALCVTSLGASCALKPGRVVNEVFTDSADVPPATCSESVSLTYEVSEFSDPAERLAIVQGAQMWHDLSGGQISFAIVYDAKAPDAHHIHRLHSDDAVVLAFEAKQAHQPYVVMGWEENATRDVNLVVDMLPVSQLHSLAAHELGHAAGLRWPLCFGSTERCDHSPDPKAVMAVEFAAVPELTPSDLAFCRASCLCP